jgi:hypothetical protein
MPIKRAKFSPLFEAAKPFVLERDQNRCVKCGSALSLEIHHIEGYKINDPEYLATLCYLCHGVAPMGKTAFSVWISYGETGAEIFQRHLAKHNLTLNTQQITAFCSALVEMELDIRKFQLRQAREYIRNSGLRCEGRKPYGYKPGETEIINTMRSLRASRLSYDKIAEALNANGIPSRSGILWNGCTISRILKRIDKY